MGIRQHLRGMVPARARHALRHLLGGIFPDDNLGAFVCPAGTDVKEDLRGRYGYSGDLADLFVKDHAGLRHKWHHYIPLYDRYFSRFRRTGVRFLEIGVSKGGSLRMWRDFLGDEAIIFGIDVDPACRQYDGVAAQVRIGSQDDTAFLEGVLREMGGVDVVLDDGSHQMKHITASLEFLFPRLSEGGIYMIEDLHAAYWHSYGGGYRRKGNFFHYLRELSDDLHRWYHGRGSIHPAVSGSCTGVHIHDSLVVLEKGKVSRPVHSIIGA